MKMPTAPKPNPSMIPERLRAFDSWVVWRYEKPSDEAIAKAKAQGKKIKPLKVPYYTNRTARKGRIVGEKPSGNDEDYLDTFETAMRVYRASQRQARPFDGVGLAVFPYMNLTIIDLDECIDEAGQFSPFAQQVVNSGVYAERSPSGRGIRAVYHGELAPNMTSKRNFRLDEGKGERVEVYCGGAYTTFTGDAIIPEGKEEPGKVKAMAEHMRRRLKDAMGRVAARSGGTAGVMDMDALLKNFTIKQARVVLSKLPEHWGEAESGTWYRVAAALHLQFDGSDEAYQVLDEWSSGKSGYDEEGNRRRWETGFSHEGGGDGFTTVRNLVYEASYNEDNKLRVPQKTWQNWGLPGKSPYELEKTAADEENDEEDDETAINNPKDSEKIALEIDEIREKVKTLSFAGYDKRPPQAVPLVPHWLYRKTVALLSADGGSGKSFAGLEFALICAMGGSWGGQKALTTKPVLFISAEDNMDTIVSRLWGLCEKHKYDRSEVEERLIVQDWTDLDSTALYKGDDRSNDGTMTRVFDMFSQDFKNGEYEIAVIDNISKVYQGNENARVQVETFITQTARLCIAQNASVLLVGHDAKPTSGNKRSAAGYSGSTAWNNGVRMRWNINKKEGEPIKLTVEKSNYGGTGHGVYIEWDEKNYVMAHAATFDNRAVEDSKRAQQFAEAIKNAISSMWHDGEEHGKGWATVPDFNEPKSRLQLALRNRPELAHFVEDDSFEKDAKWHINELIKETQLTPVRRRTADRKSIEVLMPSAGFEAINNDEIEDEVDPETGEIIPLNGQRDSIL